MDTNRYGGRILSFKKPRLLRPPAGTKFGGQPDWLTKPQWPISRSTGKQMRFICQIDLEGNLACGGQRRAFLFMTELGVHNGSVEDTWLPAGGENAVILQPEVFEPCVDIAELSSGPTLQNDGHKGRDICLRVEFGSMPEPDPDQFFSAIGGEPLWFQNDETPDDGDWEFLLQLDSCEKEFWINFGDMGVAYSFIRRDGKKAIFLWQCG